MVLAEDFMAVQREVSDIIRDRVLIGHSLKHDLRVLFLSHPKRNIRDTARYKPFMKVTKGKIPPLKRLAKEILGLDIQEAEHSCVEDARAAMQLYCTVAEKWEANRRIEDDRRQAKMNKKRGRRRIEDERRQTILDDWEDCLKYCYDF